MRILLALFLLTFATGCPSTNIQPDFVGNERKTYTDFAPIVSRDVATGHPDSQRVYDAWDIHISAAERAVAATTQP